MVTDQQLSASIASDPFHQAMAEGADDPTPVLDLLAQLFPSTDAQPCSSWGPWATKRTARATFTRSSLRPRQ